LPQKWRALPQKWQGLPLLLQGFRKISERPVRFQQSTDNAGKPKCLLPKRQQNQRDGSRYAWESLNTKEKSARTFPLRSCEISIMD
jgi:hypothetical protein